MARRLTTILAADIEGFSRLVGADEEGVLAALRLHRAELIDPLMEKFGGRIANTAGDSLLIEFRSAVEAVRCAIAFQDGMADRNSGTNADAQIRFRIGINVGDVIAEGDREDLLGDGVNIAARLEALAPPGGIIFSGTVHDQVRDRLDLPMQDLGEISVKNIERPVRAYQVLKEGETAIRAPRKPAARRTVFAAIAAVAAVIVAAGLYFQGQRLWTATPDAQTADLALPDKPSIAVLPFANLSEDQSQTWLGDGMAEDIITDLSKVSGLFVIARNSSFQYRGDDLDLRRVGRELGVRYLLEGSVRRAGDTLRINAQLIDAASGGHLWADRYDGTASDVFALQDRVTARVVESLELVLTNRESAAITARETDNPAAHDAFLQGLSHLRQATPQDFAEARRWFAKALDLDPDYPRALGARAHLYLKTFQRGWGKYVGIRGRSEVIAATHAALKHPSPLAHATEAELLLGRPDAAAARQAIDRGLALDPNDADMHSIGALVEAALGNHEKAVELAKRSLRLDPRYPPIYLYVLGIVHQVAGENEAALELFDRTLERNPDDWNPRVRRAAALVELGRTDEAAAELDIVRKNWPKTWGPAQFNAPTIAWMWGHSYGDDLVKRLEKDFLAAGLHTAAEEYELRPENRLDRADLDALLGKGKRTKGRCCGGEWMTDVFADGTRQEYWNGAKTRTSKRVLHEDGTMEIRPDDPLAQVNVCQVFRNSKGANDTLDAYLSVCTSGVYPFGAFPLP